MSADVRTALAEWVARLRLMGRSALVELTPEECAELAQLINQVLKEAR